MDVKRIFNKGLDLIFPPKCIFCGQIMRIGTTFEMCTDCSANLPWITANACVKCGKPTGLNENKMLCSDCKNAGHLYARGTSVFAYTGMVKKALQRMKFEGRKRYAIVFGFLMAQQLKKMKNWPIINIVAYTPLHKKRYAKRGFNQAKLLANEIAKHLKYTLAEDILYKVKNTPSQSSLARGQRQQNLYNAFRLNTKIDVKDKNILLVDDIYTTGTTVNECTRYLKAAGAKGVYVITVAIGKGR